MRGVFDDREVERASQRRETELTLGSGTLLGIFLGLVLLCGLFFGMGYSFGHRTPGPSASATPQAAPDQEPLQANASIPKPSAIEQPPVAPVPADASLPDQAGTAGATATQSSQPAAATTVPLATVPQANTPVQTAVHPAMPGEAPGPASSAPSQAVHPALGSQPFVVQIAAVSNPVDADVLVDALRKRNYQVNAHRDPGDNLIHVRIGPFASYSIADQWRLKLLNDGYNAVIQP